MEKTLEAVMIDTASFGYDAKSFVGSIKARILLSYSVFAPSTLPLYL